MASETPFGQWLKQQRKMLDLTQEALAMRIHVTWEMVRKYESGTRRPSTEVAELLADVFHIPPEERTAFVRFARSGLGVEHFLALSRAVVERPQVPNNLPSARTTFIGRESLIASVCALLRRPAVRLLTLTGPAGIGKTRLSQQAAGELLEEFPGGVFFVPLAAVTDPDLVAPVIVQTLGAALAPDQPALQRLKEYLRDRQMLLVLDNFEQVVQAGTLVAQLLETCPKLKIMVTSRAVLQVYGEHEYPVQPMSLPGKGQLLATTLEVLGENEAVELFIQRSEAVKPEFTLTEENAPSIVEICHRLEGLPLAIELAAARSNMLSPQAIVSRLGSRLKLLTAGAQDVPTRQRTLRSAIAWSYDLLDAEEKRLFARLGVFVGGCTLGAAEAVAGDVGSDGILDQMASLAGKSLLEEEDGIDGEPRFLMLETIREYALEKLEESGDAQEVQQRHAAYFLELIERTEPKLISGERDEWLASLDAELDNFRAVLTRCLSSYGEGETGLRVAAALRWFWYFRSYLTEGYDWLEKVLSVAPALQDGRGSLARARALNGLARLLARMGRYNDTRPWLEECVVICRKLGERSELAYALALLGLAEVRRSKPGAIAVCEESVSLFEEMEDKWGLAYALDMFADAMSWISLDKMEPLVLRSLELYRELGDDVGIATELSSLGGLAEFNGDYLAATRYTDEALVINYALGDSWSLAHSTIDLARLSQMQGDHLRAKALYEQAVPMFRELGSKRNVATALRCLGYLAYDDGDYDRAMALTWESLLLATQLDISGQAALCLVAVGGLAAMCGHTEQAAVIFGAAGALGLDQTLSFGFARVDKPRYDSNLALVRKALGNQVFAEAWEHGHSMSLDHVIDYASDLLLHN